MHDVVPIAVRNAVSAATITFTATSIILFFFIVSSFRFQEAGASVLSHQPSAILHQTSILVISVTARFVTTSSVTAVARWAGRGV